MKKGVPKFWWDFVDEGGIVVESDEPQYPVLRYYEISKYEDAEPYIKEAEQFIEDLRAGRVTLKQVHEEYERQCQN